jgi:hypothetical protein
MPAVELYDLAPEEFATACRRAYLRVVLGAHVGWGKPELAKWLAGTYHALAVHDGSSEPPPSMASGEAAPSDDRIQTLLEAMRVDVLVVLRELMHLDGISAFTKLAFDADFVARTDGDGSFAVLPRARPRMTLVDRVLSLVAVDVITRPEDFEHSLFVCERCDQPVFDVARRPYGSCRVHVSGVQTTDDHQDVVRGSTRIG